VKKKLPSPFYRYVASPSAIGIYKESMKPRESEFDCATKLMAGKFGFLPKNSV
jgi:hypothetical protein